ncbi:VOC family protein [Siccirubricoccus sp. G192]|uniref:VOC family protein n=1 Tax=Siccirubricoccus sp. G192 TaxID=2849651 RepID=UPI001C2BCF5F|nr:VOC family protein [Siccirubricoccus sp. G192]MBV1799807.1 VOC family protein [Siccirubricoccus sp. G192]
MPDFHARLSHVALQVQDLPRMQRFYAEVLGLEVSDQGTARDLGCEMVFMSGSAAAHHQLVLMSGAPGQRAPSRVNHLAFAVDSLAALRAIRDHALALGATGMRQIDHGNAWSVYFADPEGNPLEAFLDTPFHVPQPHGRAFDLDQPDAVIIAETERACRQDPGFLPRTRWAEQHAARLGT